jgi:hypothetical protein
MSTLTSNRRRGSLRIRIGLDKSDLALDKSDLALDKSDLALDKSDLAKAKKSCHRPTPATSSILT